MQYEMRRFKNNWARWRMRYFDKRLAFGLLVVVVALVILAPPALALLIHTNYLSRAIPDLAALPSVEYVVVIATGYPDVGLSEALTTLEQTVSPPNSPQGLFIPASTSNLTAATDIQVESPVNSLEQVCTLLSQLSRGAENRVVVLAHAYQLTNTLYVCQSLGVKIAGMVVTPIEGGYKEDAVAAISRLISSIWRLNMQR